MANEKNIQKSTSAGRDGTNARTPASSNAVQGASLLVVLQVASRMITFMANQILLRFLTAQLLGISTQLEIYYLSVLFFARESMRVAIQRHDAQTNRGSQHDALDSPPSNSSNNDAKSARAARSTQAVVNLAYMSIILGVGVSILFGWLYLASLNPATLSSTPFLAISLYIYGASAIIELLSEPAFVVMQIRLQFRTRAVAEAAATFFRCLATLATSAWAYRWEWNVGVLPFALGQLTYGVALISVYAFYAVPLARREGFWLLPRQPGENAVSPKQKEVGEGRKSAYIWGFFHRPTLTLASSMMAQSIVKHVLTQGDTFLISILSTPTAQGVYALANNYGGLVARLVFQPVEETCRSYFSRLLSATPNVAEASLSVPQPERNQQDGSTDERRKEGSGNAPDILTSNPTRPVSKASSDLVAILKAYTVISLPMMALGPTTAPILLSLVAGPRWAASGAGECLAAYVWYIPLLALNGVLEAFVASVATQSEVHAQSVWMGCFSAIFAGAGFLFLRVLGWGAVGLVAANVINMVCRIVWCIWFIKGFFRRAGVPLELDGLKPEPYAFLAAVVASQVVGRAVHHADGAILGPLELLVNLGKVGAVAVPLLLAL